MARIDRIERRLKLHDVRVLMSVVEAGSMAKAAECLGTSQPAVSRSIADLEHTLGVRLLERSPRGVEPTQYGARHHPARRCGVRRAPAGRQGHRVSRRSDRGRASHRMPRADRGRSGADHDQSAHTPASAHRLSRHDRHRARDLSGAGRPHDRGGHHTGDRTPGRGRPARRDLVRRRVGRRGGRAQPVDAASQDRAGRTGERALGADATRQLHDGARHRGVSRQRTGAAARHRRHARR